MPVGNIVISSPILPGISSQLVALNQSGCAGGRVSKWFQTYQRLQAGGSETHVQHQVFGLQLDAIASNLHIPRLDSKVQISSDLPTCGCHWPTPASRTPWLLDTAMPSRSIGCRPRGSAWHRWWGPHLRMLQWNPHGNVRELWDLESHGFLEFWCF